jgi:hypothetical protein
MQTSTIAKIANGQAGVFDWRRLLKVHPAAELFPLMAEAELDELAADIAKNGLRSPIVLWAADNGECVLDGRIASMRWRGSACSTIPATAILA